MSEFGKAIAEAYAVDGAAIDLGRGVHDGALAPEAVVFAADVKGDLSGIAAPGAPGGPAEKRMVELGLEEAEPEPARSGVGGTDVLGDFLRSREGKAFGRKVARGVFGMLRKRL